MDIRPQAQVMEPKFPVSMMIMCKHCGKHFDIVVAGKGSQSYCCSVCGKVQIFHYTAFVKGAVEQCYKMLAKASGSRGV
jgi:hypothetical protein